MYYGLHFHIKVNEHTDIFKSSTQSKKIASNREPVLHHKSVIVKGKSYYKVLFICYNVLHTHLPNEQSKVSGKTTYTEKGGMNQDLFSL